MNTRPPLSPGQRHAAWSRLGTLTTSVAMAGVAATVAIGTVAAIEDPGTSGPDAAAVQGDGTGADDNATDRYTTAAPDLLSGGQAPATTTPTTRNRVQATAPPTRGSGHGHASSGGS